MWRCLGQPKGAHMHPPPQKKGRSFSGFIAFLCDNVLKTWGACAPPEPGMRQQQKRCFHKIFVMIAQFYF